MTLLGFDQGHEDEAGPRSRRGALRRFGTLVTVLAVLLAVGGYAITRLTGQGAPDYPGPGSGRTYVHVPAGATATAIGAALVRAGVVASVGAFKKAAEHDPRSVGIEPGYYALARRMSAVEALQVLEDPAHLVQRRLTVPEGTSLKQLLPLVAARTALPLAALQAVVAQPARLGLPSYAQGHVEGFLFPATYELPPGISAVRVLQMMVARFVAAADQVGLLPGSAALHASPLQVVIIASILERESAGPGDAAKVARVFYNRLAAGMPLGSEFTYAYAGGDPGNPYNTYTHVGYPPGPYDSPGTASLMAALHPAPGPWRYFITLPNHTTLFATNDRQFEADRQTCLNMGGCRS